MTKRKSKVVPNFPGIYQNLVWEEKAQKWVAPRMGAKYRVARPGRTAEGFHREWEHFETFAEAKAFRNRTGAPAGAPVPVAPAEPGGPTLKELIEVWKLNCLAHKQPTTRCRYASYLQHFLLLENQKVEAIKPIDIDRWLAHIKTPEYLGGHHATRLNYEHEFSVLRGILVYYVERFNPEYRLPFVKGHKAMLRVREKPELKKDLSVEQVRAFLTALREDVFGKWHEVVYYVAAMQYLTYARVQEAAALHYEDFDFERRRIHVRRKVQWLRQSGQEDRIVDGSKANGGKVIDLPQNATALFREWTMKQGIRSGPLFLFKGKLLPYRVIEYRYSKALIKLGLPFRATHILRHASLTEHYQLGKDLLSTAKVAGHGDTTYTQKYAKARDEVLAEIQRQMDEKLGSLFVDREVRDEAGSR